MTNYIGIKLLTKNMFIMYYSVFILFSGIHKGFAERKELGNNGKNNASLQ